jgi:hypothetical protein
MKNLINNLCKNKSVNSIELEEQLNISTFSFDNLVNYKQIKTGDSLINYAAQFGNLKLLSLVYQKILRTNPLSIHIFHSSNNDGKNGLHEVNKKILFNYKKNFLFLATKFTFKFNKFCFKRLVSIVI